MIKFLFFAQLADLADCDVIELPYVNEQSVKGYLPQLGERLPSELIDALEHDVTMLSINQKFAAWEDTPQDGDEIAMLPPFSGG